MPYIPEHLATLQICEGCNGDKSTAMGKHNPEEKADIPRPNIPLQFILRKNAETMRTDSCGSRYSSNAKIRKLRHIYQTLYVREIGLNILGNLCKELFVI